MQSRTITLNNTESKRLSNLMYYVITNNLTKIKQLNLVNRSNVNNIIDTINNSTALHYSLQLSDQLIADFLLNLGADPMIKNKANHNSYDLSLQYNKNCVYNFIISDKETQIDELKDNTEIFKKKIKLEQDSNDFLSSSINNYRSKIDSLQQDISILKEINKTIVNENIDLLEQTNTLKRKVERLNNSIDGFIDNNRK